MKLAVFAHCAIDTIQIGSSQYEQIGGSGCYCSMMARKFALKVDLVTKFGPNFPQQYLKNAGVSFVDSISKSDTTRFKITIDGSERHLYLEHECVPIQYQNIDADCHLISPIYHEISFELFSRLKKDSKFLLVDPQGFLRRVDTTNLIKLEPTDLDLAGVDAIKINADEGACLAKGTPKELMLSLQKRGVQYVLFTDKTMISLLVKDKIYSITLPNKQIYDTTGVGDIFCTAFCATMLREDDFLWALCFAGGAAQATLDSKEVGLQKIPKRGTIQTNASYFYNLVKFYDI